MPKSKEPGLVFLDALRGLAALVVFLGHAKFFLVPFTLGEAIAGGAILTIVTAVIMQFFVYGHQAVIVFIFLSGFWVAYSQMHRKLNKKDFLKRRFTKVYLPYLFAILVGLAIDFIGRFLLPEFYAKLVFTIESFISTVFLYGSLYGAVGSNTPIMTVGIIIICYLLFLVFEKRIWLGFLVGILGTLAYLFYYPDPLFFVCFYFIIWLMGAVTSRFYFGGKKLNLKSLWQKVGVRIIDLAGILWILWVLYKNFALGAWYADLPEDIFLGLSMSWLVYRMLTTKFKIVIPKFFNTLSDYSYSLYLIHYPIIVILYALFGKDLIWLIICIVLVTILTFFFNYLVRYSNRVYDKLTSESKTK
jgi:peptidoglycan/LPS O-acetylase OafA/YrhL